ncbi:MAG TPA: anion transporter [Solibacterales bacterium]|nr:anion transporter [Bryobacterales bacterium]
MIALCVFVFTYAVVAAGGIPGLRLDRTGAALLGAALMVGLGVIGFGEAIAAIDFRTLALLTGMMIVVANLRLAGFFRLVAAWGLRHTHAPRTLLAAVVAVSGLLSALYVNDTVCLALTPLVLEVTGALRRNAAPYLLAVAMAANAGSVATVTGNPQNMIAGSLSGIGFREFAGAMAPVGVFSMAAVYVLIELVYRGEFAKAVRVEPAPRRPRVHRALLAKSLAVSGALLAGFFAGLPLAETALAGGALLLVTRRVKPEKVYRQMDWPLLVLFAGLFVVVRGVEKSPLTGEVFGWAAEAGLHRFGVLSAVSAVLSNLVSNVPAVLLFRPVAPALPDPQGAWLVVAMSSTLAGNLTILGSVANLIVVERARKDGVVISFLEYARIGVPLTVVTVVGGTLWLMWLRAV